MELQQLIGFYHIVQLGSFTRAAEATFRTQSALSQQIKKLENELDAVLFERIGKQGIQLTTAGKRVFAFVEQLMLSRKQLFEELAELKGETVGSVSIAAPLAIMHFFLADVLTEFTEKFPKVDLTIRHTNPQDCIDMVLSGTIDFALVHGSTVPGNLETIPWKEGEYALMVPKGHELTQKKDIRLEDLAAYPLILPEKNVKYSARSLFDAGFEDAGLSYKVIMETPNIQLNAEYVSRGMGVSCILSYGPFREAYKDRVDFILLSHILPAEKVAIIMRKGRSLSTTKQSLINHILQS